MRPATLSFESEALERCFLAADILHEDHAGASCEYALLGLAREDDPGRIVATPLLAGQRGSRRAVELAGSQVLETRREVERLARERGERLVPVSFVHRHPGPCRASRIDREFLRGVFTDQTSTVLARAQVVDLAREPLPCACAAMTAIWRRAGEVGRPVEIVLARSTCFSLIVNRERDHALYAVRCDFCPLCGRRSRCFVPASLEWPAGPPLEPDRRAALRRALADELGRKLVQEAEPAGGVDRARTAPLL